MHMLDRSASMLFPRRLIFSASHHLPSLSGQPQPETSRHTTHTVAHDTATPLTGVRTTGTAEMRETSQEENRKRKSDETRSRTRLGTRERESAHTGTQHTHSSDLGSSVYSTLRVGRPLPSLHVYSCVSCVVPHGLRPAPTCGTTQSCASVP